MHKKRPILLIDDNLIDVMRFKRALLDLKSTTPLITADTPENTHVSLSKYTHCQPFLVIADLYIYSNKSLALMRFLKQEPLLKGIPIVILTDSEADTDIIQCYQNGVSGYLKKSLDYYDFVKTVHVLLTYWELSKIPEISTVLDTSDL